MPITATVPNIANAGAAEHGRRDRSDDRADLREQPDDIMNTPAVATTQRLLTRVSRTRPTFSAKRYRGTSSGCRRVSSPGRRPASPAPCRSADRLLDDLAGREHVTGRLDRGDEHDDDHRDDRREPKVGAPKWNGVVTPNGRARPTPEKSVIAEDRRHDGAEDQAREHGDRGQEAPAEVALSTRMMSSSVTPASSRFWKLPKSFGGRVAAAGFAERRLAAARGRCTVMTVPVTIGGKNRMSWLKYGADEERHDARDDDGAIDAQQARHAATLGQPDRDHRRDGGERHALKQRQANADFPEPDGLDDRSDAAGEQVGMIR